LNRLIFDLVSNQQKDEVRSGLAAPCVNLGSGGLFGMKIYTLRQEQWIARPIDKVFAFFSDARNLEAITPPWVGFKILSMSSDATVEGTEICYQIRLHGIPIQWRTEIIKWDPPYSFVDVQRSGPYKLWEHTHRFEAHGDRTKMNDEVRYALPFGVLGRVAHRLIVSADVRKIFEYRRGRIDEYFATRGVATRGVATCGGAGVS
jgi:ligand-binding SRPBCC domain-containing protein